MSQLLLQLIMMFFLIGYIIFPIDQLQIGSLYILFQLLGSLNGCLYFYICFLFLDLLLQPD